MKTLKMILLVIILFGAGQADAQIWNKLKKKAEKAAEEAVIKEISKKKKKKKTDAEPYENQEPKIEQIESGRRDFSVFTKFDFVAGEDILFYDDFTSKALGDFPSNWDTNGSGELVDFNGEKWFRLTNKSTYIPILPEILPEEYTIEFDMYALNNANNGSQARAWFWAADNNSFNRSTDWAGFNIGFWDRLPTGLRIQSKKNEKDLINNVIQHDLRSELKNVVRMSIAVNKKRFRFWMNEKKIIDVPRLVPEANLPAFKIKLEGFSESLLINNFKIASGGQNLYEQLNAEGRFSTTGIHFDSGSDSIKPESYGTLKKIAEALNQGAFQTHIIGHTDDEGDSNANLILSQKRADNVKMKLISLFNVDGTLITTEGKGEIEPIAENDTPHGKAKNRRVEFIKL